MGEKEDVTLKGEDATHWRTKGRTSSIKGDIGCLRKRQQRTEEEEVTSEKEKVRLEKEEVRRQRRKRKSDFRGRGRLTSKEEVRRQSRTLNIAGDFLDIRTKERRRN